MFNWSTFNTVTGLRQPVDAGADKAAGGGDRVDAGGKAGVYNVSY